MLKNTLYLFFLVFLILVGIILWHTTNSTYSLLLVVLGQFGFFIDSLKKDDRAGTYINLFFLEIFISMESVF